LVAVGGNEVSGARRPVLASRRVTLWPGSVMRQYEPGGDGQFHDGLLTDLLREDLAR
jgi:hypothetical protein